MRAAAGDEMTAAFTSPACFSRREVRGWRYWYNIAQRPRDERSLNHHPLKKRTGKVGQQIKWFAREFSFGLSAGMFPLIVERVRGTPARIEDRVGSLSREVLTRRDGDAWSIQEHVGHLLDLEPLGIGRLEDYAAGLEVLRGADPDNRKTHGAGHNSRPITELLKSFRAERMEFVRRLESFDEEFILRTALQPRLNQQMSVTDLTFFIAEHDDHHLAKMTELLRVSG